MIHRGLPSLDAEHDVEVDQAEVDDAWRVELRRRIDDIDSAEVELVSGRETIAMARARLAARHQ